MTPGEVHVDDNPDSVRVEVHGRPLIVTIDRSSLSLGIEVPELSRLLMRENGETIWDSQMMGVVIIPLRRNAATAQGNAHSSGTEQEEAEKASGITK